MLTNYVKKEHYDNLRKFSYSGQNFSILYNLFLGNLAQSFVNLCPTWLAPNLITATGFAFLFSCYVLVFIFNPMFDQDLPQWLCYYIAFSLFAYQTLDNADGKQARRIKQSTALGMLLDHGSDCTATWIVGQLAMNALKVKFEPINMLIVVLICYLGFYFGVYCQFHTGVFQLGVINGVDEGLPVLQMIFILTGIFSSQFWESQLTLLGITIKYNDVFLIFSCIACIVTVAQFCYPVFQKFQWNAIKILQSLELPLSLMVIFLSIIYLSPTNVASKWFQLYILIIGCQWSKMINLLQLAILTKDQFSQFRFSWTFTLGSILLNLLSQYFTSNHLCLIDEVTLAFCLLIFSSLSYIHCIISIVTQLCHILDINLFSIKNRSK